MPDQADYAYSWSPPLALQSSATYKDIKVAPSESQVYTITVTSPNGCLAEKSVKVFVMDKLRIPTAFSPNSDGINDTFEIFNADGQIETIRIYNRWGEIIFYSKAGYKIPWDGTYRQLPVAPGIYPYVITTTDRLEYRGDLLLLR